MLLGSTNSTAHLMSHNELDARGHTANTNGRGNSRKSTTPAPHRSRLARSFELDAFSLCTSDVTTDPASLQMKVGAP